MKYDIYFHNDFDGRASAAIVLRFLRDRGDDIEHFTPVDFDIQDQWLEDDFFKKHRLFRGRHNPAIVVDFLYHPGAAMWFDHHPTSIKRDDWRKAFKRSKTFNWDSSYPSCCHWVYVALKRNYGWKPPVYFRELATWLDVIDGARYRSAKQAIEMKEPALQLKGFIEKAYADKRLSIFTIKQLAEHPLEDLAANPRIKKIVKAYRQDIATSLAFYRKNLKIYGRVGLIDLTRTKTKRLLYAPYYLHPDLQYAIRFTKKGRTWFHPSVGENPWRPKRKVHIGKLVQRYGGGGHETVGGIEFENRAAAEKAIAEIITILNLKQDGLP